MPLLPGPCLTPVRFPSSAFFLSQCNAGAVVGMGDLAETDFNMSVEPCRAGASAFVYKTPPSGVREVVRAFVYGEVVAIEDRMVRSTENNSSLTPTRRVTLRMPRGTTAEALTIFRNDIVTLYTLIVNESRRYFTPTEKYILIPDISRPEDGLIFVDCGGATDMTDCVLTVGSPALFDVSVHRYDTYPDGTHAIEQTYSLVAHCAHGVSRSYLQSTGWVESEPDMLPPSDTIARVQADMGRMRLETGTTEEGGPLVSNKKSIQSNRSRHKYTRALSAGREGNIQLDTSRTRGRQTSNSVIQPTGAPSATCISEVFVTSWILTRCPPEYRRLRVEHRTMIDEQSHPKQTHELGSVFDHYLSHGGHLLGVHLCDGTRRVVRTFDSNETLGTLFTASIIRMAAPGPWHSTQMFFWEAFEREEASRLGGGLAKSYKVRLEGGGGRAESRGGELDRVRSVNFGTVDPVSFYIVMTSAADQVASTAQARAADATPTTAVFKTFLFHTGRDRVFIVDTSTLWSRAAFEDLEYIPWVECGNDATTVSRYDQITFTLGKDVDGTLQTKKMGVCALSQTTKVSHSPNSAVAALIGHWRAPWFGNILVAALDADDRLRDVQPDDLEAARECVRTVVNAFLEDNRASDRRAAGVHGKRDGAGESAEEQMQFMRCTQTLRDILMHEQIDANVSYSILTLLEHTLFTVLDHWLPPTATVPAAMDMDFKLDSMPFIAFEHTDVCKRVDPNYGLRCR
ncbi:hypothetical protein C8R43DRAFT_947202 [Mycena crocata]|nr:hypothetical protein C8R43DRAFT_947202 [Mycena crocata]